jgi:light-regulated signal transduction histidine kinase (bacteriophytochrome)
MTQVLQNLIGNAIKFRGADVPEVTISVHENSREWIFSVQDNGIGIDRKNHDKLFQMFQRLHTHDEFPGKGLAWP